MNLPRQPPKLDLGPSMLHTPAKSGDFFRKGGANVVDAFERLQDSHPGIRLTLCCADSDFHTPNATRNARMRQIYDEALA